MAAHLAADELRVWLGYRHAFPQGVQDAPAGGGASAPVPATAAPAYHGVLDVECPYTQRHYEAAFAARPWWRVVRASQWGEGAPAPLQITEYEPVDWDAVLRPPHVVTNNLMVRKGLCRKANFALAMRRHVGKCGAVCPLAGGGLPDTAVIDTVPVFHDRPQWLDLPAAMADALGDADDLVERGRAEGARLWILKPSLANKAAEIHIVTGLEEVEAALRTWRDVGQWVLQRYVERPLTVGGGRKFHLRVYALADGALDAYVFSEALVLLAVEPFRPSAGDPAARHAHITNSCVGAEHGGFAEEAHVRALSELPGMLVEEGAVGDLPEGAARVGALVARIHAAVAHVFDAYYGGMGGYQALPNAFELYGLDFLVDEAWQVVLLEANPTPDVRQTGARLDGVIADLLEGAVRIAVDGRFPRPPGWGGAGTAAPPPLPPLKHDWVRVYSKPWPAAAGAAAGGAR